MIETICHDSCFNNESNFAVSQRKSKNPIKTLKMNDETKPRVFLIFKLIRRLFKNVFAFFVLIDLYVAV